MLFTFYLLFDLRVHSALSLHWDLLMLISLAKMWSLLTTNEINKLYYRISSVLSSHFVSILQLFQSSVSQFDHLSVPDFTGSDTPLLDIQPIREARCPNDSPRSLSLICKAVATTQEKILVRVAACLMRICMGMDTLAKEQRVPQAQEGQKGCNCICCKF